jgi:hypothetical protein
MTGPDAPKNLLAVEVSAGSVAGNGSARPRPRGLSQVRRDCQAERVTRRIELDARILAQLLAGDFLPPIWLPGERTRCVRRQVTRRAHIVQQRT